MLQLWLKLGLIKALDVNQKNCWKCSRIFVTFYILNIDGRKAKEIQNDFMLS